MTAVTIILSVLSFIFASAFIGVCCRAMDRQDTVERLNRRYEVLSRDRDKEHGENTTLNAKLKTLTVANKNLTGLVKGKAYLLSEYEKSCSDIAPEYRIDVCGHEYYVVRRSHKIDSTIKVFDTTDGVYNGNCAQELLDKLTEGLCYD